jgi:2-polyprenylphenol 6-hydroxylase
MDVDVAIVGAGLVGASFARALERSGLKCALIDGASPPPPKQEAWDVRVYAVSPASQSFLQTMAVWDKLDARRMQPIRTMQVRGGPGSRLEFSAYEAGVERLATIVEAGMLQRALWQAVERQPGLELLCPARPTGIELRAECVVLELAEREPLRARVLVGADGANSWVRQAGGMALKSAPVVHTGVVANFACAKPHREVAFQWFRSDGVLAWLPLPGRHFSMVWSTDEANAHALLSATPADLCARVAEAGAHTLGMLELVTPAAAFPIAPSWVPKRTRPRMVLIGDAAHVVHPLAGQGVNLGFGDAQALAALFCEARDPGDWLTLRRFERQRASDILAMRVVTQGLQRLFAAPWAAVVQARNAGLTLTDRLPVLKNLLARRAMGSF